MSLAVSVVVGMAIAVAIAVAVAAVYVQMGCRSQQTWLERHPSCLDVSPSTILLQWQRSALR
jgi:hypothetical protein